MLSKKKQLNGKSKKPTLLNAVLLSAIQERKAFSPLRLNPSTLSSSRLKGQLNLPRAISSALNFNVTTKSRRNLKQVLQTNHNNSNCSTTPPKAGTTAEKTLKHLLPQPLLENFGQYTESNRQVIRRSRTPDLLPMGLRKKSQTTKNVSCSTPLSTFEMAALKLEESYCDDSDSIAEKAQLVMSLERPAYRGYFYPKGPTQYQKQKQHHQHPKTPSKNKILEISSTFTMQERGNQSSINETKSYSTAVHHQQLCSQREKKSPSCTFLSSL